jgi:hypothetical protein
MGYGKIILNQNYTNMSTGLRRFERVYDGRAEVKCILSQYKYEPYGARCQMQNDRARRSAVDIHQS